MATNIVFLDFDDVLNNGTTDCEAMAYLRLVIARNRGKASEADKANIDEYAKGLFRADCIATLNQAIKLFQVKLVLSTNWMEHLTLNDAKRLLEINGVTNLKFYEKCPVTPRKRTSRAEQIEDALMQIDETFNFVILDDRMSGTGLTESAVLKDRVIWCDRDEKGDFLGQGLQRCHLDLMVEHLELKN